MTTDPVQARRAARVGLAALVAFWLLVLLGTTLQPDYDWTRDFVSALASEGARHPYVGVVALLSFGVAYLSAAVVLASWVGTRFGAALLVGAGLLTWVVAFARIHCPNGAAYCGVARPDDRLVAVVDDGNRFGPHLHGWAVAGSYLLVLVAMAWLAYLWWNRSRRGALLSVAAFVTSLLTVPFWLGADSPGGAQRLWLGILTAWVVLVCVQPLMGGRGAEEAHG